MENNRRLEVENKLKMGNKMKRKRQWAIKGFCIALTLMVATAGFGIPTVHGSVTSSSFPTQKNYGGLKWSLNLGTGYTDAPTPPLVHGNYVYVGTNQTLRKLDKNTGKEVGQLTLVDTFGYATAALTYAENVDGKNIIFAPISEGRVQAIDADTMKSLWVTKEYSGQSCLSRVTYDNGYLYFGTWKTDKTDGYFFCYSATDENATTAIERKTPTWAVAHTGGFYWSEANVVGNYVLFGSEDGSSGYLTSTNGSKLFSCMKGKAFKDAGKESADSPVIDTQTLYGDVRSGVAYDSQTDAYYFTSRAGRLYKVVLGEDGKVVSGGLTYMELGGNTTGTPTVYKGKVYVGIQGSTPFGTTGHAVKVINGETLSVDYSAATPGFVQSEMVLSTARETSGKLYLYMTYNQLPGGIYMMEINDVAGTTKTINDSTSGTLYTPPTTMKNYGISTLETDNDGNFYYKNDSCNLMAVTAGYQLEAIASKGGTITGTKSVLVGGSASFSLKASDGYKIADLKVDKVSQGQKSSYTFTGVTAPHSIQGIFIRTTTPNLTSAASAGYNSIKLSWTKQVGVTGYELWRATSKSGKYSKIKTLTSATTVSYTNTGLTTGKTYYYKIRGYYKNTKGSIVYSATSTGYKSAIPKLSKPTLTTTAGTDKIKLTWKKISGAQGYKIYRKTSSSGSYYRVKTITTGSTITWTNTKLTTGKTYYYKIIAYRVVSGKTYYSSYSSTSYKKAK